MNNRTVVFLDENPLTLYSSVSNRLTPTEYMIVSHGLTQGAVDQGREVADRFRAMGKGFSYMEVNKTPTVSKICHNILVGMLDDLTVDYLSFVNSPVTGKTLDDQIAILAEYPSIACGAYRKSKEFRDYVGVDENAAFMEPNIVLANRIVKPCWSIGMPFTINMVNLRRASRIYAFFNAASEGFKVCFEGPEPDFPGLFAHMFKGIQAQGVKDPAIIAEV